MSVQRRDLYLYKLLSPFGAIVPGGVRVLRNIEDGSCKGLAAAKFADLKSARAAIAVLDGCRMTTGAPLRVVMNAGASKNSMRLLPGQRMVEQAARQAMIDNSSDFDRAAQACDTDSSWLQVERKKKL